MYPFLAASATSSVLERREGSVAAIGPPRRAAVIIAP